MRESCQADQLTQIRNQGYKVAPRRHTRFMYELLEHVKGLGLQIQRYRISTTQSTVGLSIHGIAEVRDLEADQQLITANK